MTQRRALIGGLAGGLAAAALWRAQAAPRDKPGRRLGVLLYDAAGSWDFLQRDLPPALAALGWQPGRNLALDWRFADGDPQRLPMLAEQLLALGCDALLSRGTPATRALAQATRTVPIVTGVGDPVGAGFAASLARPGSNVTGLSYAQVELVTKQLEFLRAIAPLARRLLVLVPASRARFVDELTAPAQRVARAQGLQPTVALAQGLDDVRQALLAARQGQPAHSVVALVLSFGESVAPPALAAALLQAGVPAVFEQRFYVEAGGLLSYRLDWDDQTRSTALQLAKVLRGEDPAAIPFELPTRSQLVINARSARTLGLALPPALRARADEVIE
jgi:putative tryptophan/tyrosine transport system substrate-binding protein